MTPEEYDLAYNRTCDLFQKKGKEGKPAYPNGKIVREEYRNPKEPLLLLYLLDPVKSTDILDDSIPFVGYAISFPKSSVDNYVSYAIHEQLLPQFNYSDDDSEEDIDDD